MNKMYEYLKNHAYISYNKKSTYEFELSEERAKCIANKYDSLTDELQKENKKLNGAIQTYDILLKANVEENKQLQQENKILRENAENNDKVVDKVNWENQLLKKENHQLQERIEYLERSNNRREDTILEQRQEISDLEGNWNKLKEYIRKNIIYDDVGMKILDPSPLEDYIQELEQGSDSNE